MGDKKEALKKLRSSMQTVALTGAGISTASGIPDFRGTDGLWKSYDPSKYAHINTFKNNPVMVWDLALKLLDMVNKTEPNSAHFSLASMEERGFLHGIITQNIDNLHRRAGSRSVVNYHGSVNEALCLRCSSALRVTEPVVPVCEECGSIMKPGFTLFGEAVPPGAFLVGKNLASFSGVFMVIGTSAVVQPAADLPFIAKDNGAYIIEMNSGETGLTNYITDCFIKGPVEVTLPELVSDLLKE